MKPLFVLLIVFVLALAGIRLITGVYNYTLAGRAAMSAMLLFTALAHFAFTKGMALMLPAAVPFKKSLVLLTGMIEIAAATGLLLARWNRLTAWLLILFFLLIIPANISAAVRHVDYKKATLHGPGKGYLWFRVPLQVLFIAWVYFFAIWL